MKCVAHFYFVFHIHSLFESLVHQSTKTLIGKND